MSSDSRNAVRDTLLGLLKYPCVDGMQKACYGLRFYCTQLWSTSIVYFMISKTDNPTLKKSSPLPSLDINDVSALC